MARIDLNAIREEATGEDHEIVLGDETFKVPMIKTWPSVCLDYLAEGDLRGAFAEAMGEEDFGRMEEHGLTIGDFNAIFDGLAEAEGLDQVGNSPGSGRSSPSTRRPSKRTSRATTGSRSGSSSKAR